MHSALDQVDLDVEPLIQDADSTDGTQEIIAEMRADQRVKPVIEPDHGQADAFNRALAEPRRCSTAWRTVVIPELARRLHIGTAWGLYHSPKKSLRSSHGGSHNAQAAQSPPSCGEKRRAWRRCQGHAVDSTMAKTPPGWRQKDHHRRQHP